MAYHSNNKTNRRPRRNGTLADALGHTDDGLTGSEIGHLLAVAEIEDTDAGSTPPLSFVGSEVSHLFERAFGRAAMSGGRPLAMDWVAALTSLEKSTKQCFASKSHW